MKNARHKKHLKWLSILFLLFISILVVLFVRISYIKKSVSQSSVTSPPQVVSTFEKFNETTMKDPILSYDFKNIALKLLGVTGMSQFEDNAKGWREFLSTDQYVAEAICSPDNLNTCTLSFITAFRDDFEPKEFKNINLPSLCPQAITSYIKGDYVYFPDDNYDSSNYVGNSFKVIFYYPKNDLNKTELAKPDWCIYYAK